jgi:hypothetical protein
VTRATRQLLTEAMQVLERCFKSLGANAADIEAEMSPELHAAWQGRPKGKARAR